ncbi:YbaB/EbfC family DNA-binding protein [Pseudonocardiaceae bacterium YIM PH 21723]|nr:YbaB/EbfC family DNA-binding protein [Pseudonocardiaceae bacterium YIM PH 21723]
MDPSVDFDKHIESLKAKAEEAQQKLRSAEATAVSGDRAVSVSVSPGGSLTNLQFGPKAFTGRTPQQLAAEVMALAGKAQQQVSLKVMDAFSGMVGEGSAAMEMLNQFLPADPQQEPAKPARPADDDDDDFYDDPIQRRR